ncbi:MAG TPA: calcium-binding protein [Actinomycetota bacterium]|nr:calcium-binding protein [Actinomycetota bacterium]
MRRVRLSVGFALTASLMAAGLIAAPPVSAAPKCFGMAATIVGTGGGDDIFGTPGVDVIVGLGGKDLLVGFGGADRLCGGDGADDIDAGGGNDKTNGGAGNDITGGLAGADLILGAGGHDLLFGGSKKDTVKGGKGSDLLFGNNGNDTLRGGGGFDILLGQGDNDVVDGDGGEDLASFFFSRNGAGITANLETGIATGEGNDTLRDVNGLQGSGDISADDEFTGDEGHDFFFPHGGADTVDGGAANDLVLFPLAPGAVTVDLQAGTAFGEGPDVLLSIEMAAGSEFGDTLLGTDGANEFYGLKGPDDITALGGDDLLSGGNGTDTGDGGDGTDTCLGIENDSNCEEFSAAVARPARPDAARTSRKVPPTASLASLRPSY